MVGVWTTFAVGEYYGVGGRCDHENDDDDDEKEEEKCEFRFLYVLPSILIYPTLPNYLLTYLPIYLPTYTSTSGIPSPDRLSYDRNRWRRVL